MKFGNEHLNGGGTLLSEKVQLDEISVTSDRHGRRRSGLMSLIAAGLIACPSRIAPI
jgi:hypothetical protein